MNLTEAQATQLFMSHGAVFSTTKNGVEWWKMPNGGWMGKRALGNGTFEVRHFPPGSCNC